MDLKDEVSVAVEVASGTLPTDLVDFDVSTSRIAGGNPII